MADHQPLGRLLDVKEVARATSLSRATIYRRVAAGTFPGSVPIGGNRSAWAETDVAHWIAEQLAGASQPAGDAEQDQRRAQAKHLRAAVRTPWGRGRGRKEQQPN